MPIRCLLAVIEHGSLSAASQHLHLTHGAISRQLSQLEDTLRTPLFERRRGRITPLAAGRELALRLQPLLLGVDFTLAQYTASTTRTAVAAGLTVSCEPTLAMRWLIARLPEWQIYSAARGKEIPLRVLAGGGPVDFAKDKTDLAIRRNDFVAPATISRTHLVDEWAGPVCAPGLASALSAPAFGKMVTLLHSETRPQAWAQWSRTSETTGSARWRGPSQQFGHFYLSLQAAVAGLGAAIGPYPLVQDEVLTGNLVAPLGFTLTGHAYCAYTERADQPDCRLLIQWLQLTLGQAVPEFKA